MTYRFSIPVLCAVLVATAAYAESLPRPPATQKIPRAGGAQAGPMAKGLGAPAVERLMSMNPEERKKALQKLPLERRKKLESRLREYDRLTPAQKAKLQLSVEQQAHLRKLYQRFNNFPLERQDALRTV